MEGGSFGFEIQVLQDVLVESVALAGMLKTYGAEDIARAIGIYGSATWNLMRAMVWARGRKVRRGTTLENGNVEVSVVGDNNKVDVINVPPDVMALLENPRVCQASKGTFKPLEQQDIDSLEFSGDGTNFFTEADAQALRAPDEVPLEDDVLDEGSFTRWVTIPKPWNEPGKKMLFDDGGSRISAEVTDPRYWQSVEQDQRPATKHALFQFRFDWTQRAGPYGPVTEYIAAEFVGYRPPAVQGSLSLDDADAPKQLEPGNEAPQNPEPAPEDPET